MQRRCLRMGRLKAIMTENETLKEEKKNEHEEEMIVQDADDMPDLSEKGKKARIRREIFSYIKILVCTFLACLILTKVVFVNAYIPSSSMEDTIMTDSRVIGVRLAYDFGDPERGDIVVFHYPVDEDTLYIKRIIGLPGETIRIEDATVYIDGVALEEDYLPEEWVSGNDGLVYEVPDGYYFMMGDNRNVSIDSRFWAQKAIEEGLADTEEEAEQYTFVARDKIVAKAWFVYWPFSDFKFVW